MEALGRHLGGAIDQLDRGGSITRSALAGAEIAGNPGFVHLEQ